MVAVTYGGARVADHAAAETKPGKTRKNIFVRVFDAIADSQTKRAERELARYRHLLPLDFDLHYGKNRPRRTDEPFGGW